MISTVSKWVPIIGTILAFWVPIGSLFIFQGPYFQCVDYIYIENVNSVCNAESVTFDTFKKSLIHGVFNYYQRNIFQDSLTSSFSLLMKIFKLRHSI